MPTTASILPSSRSPKLLAIVGPTASGKSELAMRLARHFGGEIICADSRTIYKGMDVGTAKPSKKDREEIPHFGLDLVEPGENFSVSRYKNYAKDKIFEIRSRGKLPILVGGSGLYIDSVVFDFGFRAPADLLLRNQLETRSTLELQNIISERGYAMPENKSNRRHLIRTIEVAGQDHTKQEAPLPGTLIVGINLPAEELKERIAGRAEENFAALVEETKKLLEYYGEERIVKTGGIPYKHGIEFIEAKIAKTEAIDRITADEWQYARRQRTWFKRNPHIKWFSSDAKAFLALKSV